MCSAALDLVAPDLTIAGELFVEQLLAAIGARAVAAMSPLDRGRLERLGNVLRLRAADLDDVRRVRQLVNVAAALSFANDRVRELRGLAAPRRSHSRDRGRCAGGAPRPPCRSTTPLRWAPIGLRVRQLALDLVVAAVSRGRQPADLFAAAAE